MPNKGNQEIEAHILKDYEVVAKLGSGAYGHVWRVRDRKTQETLALKKIFDAFQHATDAKRTYREITVLRQLSHPLVVRLERVVRAENNKDLYLVFEAMDCDLHYAISESSLQEAHRSYIAYQLFRCLLYIHSAQLVHRDLKPSNILINTKCKIKVCDFGLVRSLGSSPGEDPVLTKEVATRWYRAPEVLLGSRTYGYPADMWSAGCILFEMLTQKPLFPGSNELNQLQRIVSHFGLPSQAQKEALQIPNLDLILSKLPIDKIKPSKAWGLKLDPQAFDLVCKLLRYDPQARLTPEQAMRHPYVAKYYSSRDESVSVSKVVMGVNENVKLSVKQYRNLIYDEINNYYKEKEGSTLLQSYFKKYSSERMTESLKKSIQRQKSKSNVKHLSGWNPLQPRKKNSSTILPSGLNSKSLSRPKLGRAARDSEGELPQPSAKVAEALPSKASNKRFKLVRKSVRRQ